MNHHAMNGNDSNRQADISMYVVLLDSDDPKDVTWSKYLRKVSAAGHRSPDFEESLMKSFRANVINSSSQYERLILFVAELGSSLINCSGYGICLPLKEAIFHCRENPPSNWPEKAYVLIGREDLAKQTTAEIPESRKASGISDANKSNNTIVVIDEDDGMDYLDKDLLKLRFSEDLRVDEARRLLQSSRPVRIALAQRPEVSDHDFIQEQERHLYATCIRTMAIPLGRGMFTMCTYQLVPTETLPIPKLCLTGRVPPRNTTVDLTHIDTPVSMTHWPQFHNGVAAGLRIANTSQVDSPWILYNRPRSNELTIEHAGFLMGLGLNGHLPGLAIHNVHNYLCRGHEMTSIALLLGIAAGKRGTMDVATTRLLSIHVAALLPPTSTELDVPHNVQVTAVLGVGLVYQGTAHRHIAEVLLNEIGRPPGPEMENCTDRESYSLAAGLALGLVMLGKGSEHVGMSDLSMADQLYYYMVGGHKRPLTGANKERYKSPSYQIKEGDCVNIDVTSPGATLALGMMFFRTGNSAVAEWLLAPDTQFLLDFVRPDFLMLQLISRCLVLWHSVHPSEDWINSNLPEIVTTYAFNKTKFADDSECDIDFETMSQAYCNLVAGACMALGLKFAGSANELAFHALYKMAKKMLSLQSQPSLVEQAGRTTVEQSLIVITISLSMVMSGTGNLDVLRLCRHLRTRVGASHTAVVYGSHMAVSMAIGLMFLGGGRYTLSTKPESIAILLCAFFPKWPIHSHDNRYHLQAFRHLYVLATESRLLLPREVSSNDLCYVPVDISFKDCDVYKAEMYRDLAPCILPELHLLSEVKAVASRYWPVGFKHDENWDVLKQMLEQCGYLNVKQRAGHLPYSADPKGYHSVLAKSVTSDTSLGKIIKPEDVKSFCSDARIMAFAEYFCNNCNEQEYDTTQFLSRILYECVSQEKVDMLEVYLTMHQVVTQLPSRSHTLDLCQLKLVFAFYRQVKRDVATRLINEELLLSLQCSIENQLDSWQQVSDQLLVKYLKGHLDTVTETNCTLLSAFLTWHSIPHASTMTRYTTHGVQTFPELYKHLHTTGLSVAAMFALAHVLQPMAVS